MAKFRITSPDGGVYEITAPDGATESDVMNYAQSNLGSGRAQPKQPKQFGIDFNQPTDQVRAAVGKVAPEDRAEALDQWAKAHVAGERKAGGVGMAADNTVRTLARGSFVGPALDEITAGTQKALQVVSGGALGSDYDEALAYQRARDKAVDTDYPIASTVGQIAGGVAGGIGALPIAGVRSAVVRGPQVAIGGPLAAWAPAKTLRGNMAQGAVIGGAYGGSAGFLGTEGGEGTTAEQVAERMGGAGTGTKWGAAGGALLPPVISGAIRGGGMAYDAVSPQIARYSQQLRNWLMPYEMTPKSGGAAATMGGAPLPRMSGAEAAADQTIANQLARANVSIDDLRARFSEADSAARMRSNSQAQNMLAPVDIDPSLQTLAGSVGRQQPEARNIGQRFLFGRQTGTTPRGTNTVDMANVGLPTRPALGQPVTGAQADRMFGRNFGTQPQENVPMGQFERIGDAFKRALQIQDSDFHGHAANARRTDEQIIKAAKDDAKELYGVTYKAGEGVDLTPTVAPIVGKWQAALIDEPLPVANALNKAMSLIDRALSPNGSKPHIERLDKVKQWMDDQIEKAMKNDQQRYLASKLIQLKNEMIDALDSVPNVGEKYKAARDKFSSSMESRDAIKLGRDAMGDDADIGVDAYRAIGSEINEKLFRLGMLDAYQKRGSRQKRTADVTQMFETPRMQELLAEIIERSKKGNAEFSDRPERFGRFIGNEKSMIETRNVAFGGSQTQANAKADQGYDNLSLMFEQFKSTPSVTAIGLKVLEKALDKAFGFHPDTAAMIAQKLFNAEPRAREKLLEQLAQRLGSNRMQHLTRLMQEHQRLLTQAGATAGGAASQQQNQPR